MKLYKTLSLFALAFGAISFAACVDYDEPTDEFNQTDINITDSVYHGKPDSIGYGTLPTEEAVDAATKKLETRFHQTITGQYAIRGGKNGDVPGPHAYQRQYSLGPDNYAQYTTVPHSDFMYGTLKSTYDVSAEFNSGPNGSFIMVKNAIVPLINDPAIDTIPELKAIYLLLYDFAAQEVADIFGPFPYQNFKENFSNSPFVYQNLEVIYKKIVENIDDVIACLENFKNRPEWYQNKIMEQIWSYTVVLQHKYDPTQDIENWRRFANSLKLRMAMHIVKVNPTLAQTWAEEAVASGVIETTTDEAVLSPLMVGFTNPLLEIWNNWGDARLSASFESLLMSLNHPFAKSVFRKNSDPITNLKTGEVLPANTRIVGLREGIHPGQGQAYGNNQMIAYSSLVAENVAMAPLYLIKLSEVDFLRAEGALRGWNMGGDAKMFYERGIEYGYLNDRLIGDYAYTSALPEYMAQTEATPYIYQDPMGNVVDPKTGNSYLESVTKIGVAWNEGDSQETKLEKIITQKYIALFPNSWEAWGDMRRTGYPKVFPVMNADEGDGTLKYGDLIRRAPFPNTDDASVRDIDRTGLEALGGEDYQSTRLWWDVEGPNF